MMRTSSLALFAVLAACGGGGSMPPDATPTVDTAGPPDAAAPPDAKRDNGTTHVTATKMGDPKWETIGWQTFSAPNVVDTAELVWAHHTWDAAKNTFVPGPAHQAPYDQEIDDAIAANGWDPGDTFQQSDWTFTTRSLGLMFAGALVPSTGAPTGKTPDYANGPMLPDSIVIAFDGDMLEGTTVVDADFGDSTYPTLANLAPSGGYDGWSHMPFTFGEDTRFIPGTPGSYTFRLKLTEAATPANGWVIEIPFTIE